MSMTKRRKEEINSDSKHSIQLKEILNTKKRVEITWKSCTRNRSLKSSIHPAAKTLCLLQFHIKIQNKI